MATEATPSTREPDTRSADLDSLPRLNEVRAARGNAIGDLLRRSVAAYPDKLAVAHRDVRRTYAAFDQDVNRVAQALLARGISKGDRVGILSHNSYEFAVSYFALAKVGAISVPINFMLTSADVAYVLQHAGIIGLIVEDSLRETADDAIRSLPDPGAVCVRAVVGRPVGGWDAFKDWLNHDSDMDPRVEVADDDPIQIIYTSGTESRPKGAVLSSRNLVSQYASVVIDGGMSSDDVEVHALPMYHCAALHCFFSPDVWLGATSIILDGPNPRDILAAIETERATKLFCPPTVWIGLLRSDAFDSHDLSSLRKGYYGAAAMPVEILHELGTRLPKVDFYNFYGQTEMSPTATILKPHDQVSKAGSAGRPCLSVQTRIVDDNDLEVAPGEVGEIVHRGPHTMLGYWDDPDKTAEAFRGGWFHSGDLGVMDADGYLTIVDRKKDMINSGGENVASRDVEEVIYAHPDVAEVAVFAAPHAYWGEAVVAVVVPKGDAQVDPDEVISYCRRELAAFKVPKAVAVAPQLPKNPSGKILKKDLREQYADLARDVEPAVAKTT